VADAVRHHLRREQPELGEALVVKLAGEAAL
jgi:hypothetical protein